MLYKKKMVNFSNGKIYTIRSRSRPDLVYIGSTTQTLAQRLGKHRRDHRCYKNGTYHNVTSFQVLDIGDEYIELLEDFPCANKNQLLKREGELIRSTECVNRITPGRTGKQYYQDNREDIKAYQKQYYQDNQESISAWKKQHYQDNKEQILASVKQYNQDNKQAISAYQKQHYQDNQEAIKAIKNQRINCDYCDCTFSRGDKARHIKSPKHITNYKAAYLECCNEPFEGVLTTEDY